MSSLCSKCSILVNGKFCEKCGKKREEGIAHCGANWKGNFCGDCGTSLKQENKFCFVLNNYEFPKAGHILGYQNGEDANLLGYKKDSAKIRTTFESLGFVVDEKSNSETGDEMLKVLRKKWLKEKDFSQAECVVVFILSHGGEHGVLYACDGSQIHIDEIRRIFSSNETLNSVPKLFFIQACRGSDTPETSRILDTKFKKSGVQVSTESKFRDSFIYYCTHEGYAGFVSDSGSIFVSKLCEVIDEHGKTLNLWDIVTKTNKVVSESSFQYQSTVIAQCPEAVFSLCKHVKLGTLSDVDSLSLESMEMKERNPCFVISNKECATHKLTCLHFEEYKKEAVKTFSELNFNVREKDDLKLKELETMFKDLKSGKVKNIEGSECLLFVVLSCGGLNDNSPIIYGSDGCFYSIDTMIRKTIDIKGLTDKPKCFFMILKKCSREEFKKAGEEEKLVKQWKAHGTDTFIYYIVLENETHTWFMKLLCAVLVEFSKLGRHLGDVVNEVNRCMFETYDGSSEEKQTPEVCSTLTKLLKFKYVGPCPQENTKQETWGKVGAFVDDEIVPELEVNVEMKDMKSEMKSSAATNIAFDGMVMTYTEDCSEDDESDDTNDDNGNDIDDCNRDKYNNFTENTGICVGKPEFKTSHSHDNSQTSEKLTNVPVKRTTSKSFDNCMSSLLVRDQSSGPIDMCIPGILDENFHNRQVVTNDENPPEDFQNIAVVSTKSFLSGDPPPLTNNPTSTTIQSSSDIGLVQQQVYKNEGNPSTVNSDITRTNSAPGNQSSQTSHIYLSQLKFQQRKKIFTMLAHGQNNWNGFGHLLVEHHGDVFDITKEEIDHLSHSGGSPATLFLEQLSVQHTDLTLKQFSDIAKRNNRKDICNRISSWSVSEGKKLCDITHQQKKSLIRLLDKKVNGNWRDFAGELDFQNKEIRNIKETAESNRQNPAELLLELIDEKCDEFKLTDFYDLLVEITRMDVAGVVKKMMPTAQDQPPNSHFEDGLR